MPVDRSYITAKGEWMRLTFHTSLEQASSRPLPVASLTAQQQTVGSRAQAQVRAGG